MTNSDEYVIEAIITFNKLEVLIHDLLIIEIWKENVYPHLLSRLAGRNTMRTYFILYHEATIINLLEILLYHKHVCEIGGERILELVDYCARKMTRLVGENPHLLAFLHYNSFLFKIKCVYIIYCFLLLGVPCL
jgi:hypothetical protein